MKKSNFPRVLKLKKATRDRKADIVFEITGNQNLIPKEFELLKLLMENPGRVLTRQVLIDRVWGDDYVGDTKTLDVHIMRLRKRIKDEDKESSLITTIRGVGYRFDAN